ncbi:hypothetical protein [Nocardia alba]|uniref:hypothetical protein n=1 Tax=Nocardia alba TaxID=225051 RepID=UPI001048DD71|nr:hypothetical protein [Nocardia alba]
MTGALAQADRFEQIARWWDQGLRAFRHAVKGSLASAWSGTAATAAGFAVDDYVARAHDLTVALEELPGVVRAAAEAIVATKYAVGSPVVERTGAATWSVSGAAHAMGSASTHGAASSAQEDARAAMRQRYVLPFAELVARIPVLPMPLRSFDTGEADDRQLLIGAAGKSRGERRALSPGEVFEDGGQGAFGERPAAIDDPNEPGPDSDASEVQIEEPDPLDNRSAESDDDDLSARSRSAPTVTAAPSGDVTGAASSSRPTAMTTSVGAGLSTSSTGTSPAAVDPTVVSAIRSPDTSPSAGRMGPSAITSGGGDRSPGAAAWQRPPAQHDVWRPGVGHSVPGSTGPAIGGNPPSAHAVTRSGDRYFACGAPPPTAPTPGVDAVRAVPDYLITLANTAELLGVPRPAIAGGVIGGGDDISPVEQRSTVTGG